MTGWLDNLHKWACQKGKRYEWGEGGNEEQMEMNVRVVESLACTYAEYGKACKSRVSLTVHEKRMQSG